MSKGGKAVKKSDVDAKLQAIMARRENRRTGSLTEDAGGAAAASATAPASTPGAGLAAPEEGRGFLSNLKRMMSINRKNEDFVSRKEDSTAPTASLVSCPLKPEVYQKAFESGECQTYAPSSRLYTTLFAVLQDTFALELFAQFLNKQKMVDLLRFWAKAEGFHSESATKSPKERQDWALAVYRTFICRNTPQCLNFDDDVVRDVELNLSPENGDVSPTCLDKAMAAALDRLETFYFPLFLKSPEYAQLCEAVLKSDEACVEDVLYNDTALMIFMEYMDRENAAVILHFWLAADNFAQQAESGLPVAELQADADAIYNRFFSPQAREPLGVDEATRASIEARVRQPGGVTQNAFDRARHLVITALRVYFFPNFCRSDLFAKLLSDLRRVALPPTEPSRPPSPGAEARAAAAAAVESSGPGQAHMTMWGEYTSDPQCSKGPPLDHGALATQLNNIVKLTVGKLRGVRKADLDLAQRMSERLITDMYDEMAMHHTLPPLGSVPPPATALRTGPITAAAWAPPPARARPLLDEVLDPVSSSYSSADDWALPNFD
eukprot:m.22074 g.22074  ORF g.22074 m.22074 type:complete len:551 (-) comp8223_c0_seq1:69-1721(-)